MVVVLFSHGSATCLPLRGKSTHIQFQSDQVLVKQKWIPKKQQIIQPFLTLEPSNKKYQLCVFNFATVMTHDFSCGHQAHGIASIFDMFISQKTWMKLMNLKNGHHKSS